MHLAGIRGKEAARRSADLLKTVGLEDRLDHLPDELSGGEQQRVAIARALALQPPVILADEPTGNLDSESAKQILALLGQVREQFGATVVMMTHDPTAAGCCNRILSMRDGRFTDGGR
jgi:putative ABC transport system ATP-binding protein